MLPLGIAAAYHALSMLSSDDLVEIAVAWLCEGHDSDSLAVLAGHSRPIMSDVQPLFEHALAELNTAMPSMEEPIHVLLVEYLREIVSEDVAAFDGMIAIVNDLYSAAWTDGYEDWVGAVLGIERMLTWYRELQDAASGSMLLYYTDLPEEEAVAKFTEHLKEEAEILLRRLEG